MTLSYPHFYEGARGDLLIPKHFNSSLPVGRQESFNRKSETLIRTSQYLASGFFTAQDRSSILWIADKAFSAISSGTVTTN